jgi:hypothetical protein
MGVLRISTVGSVLLSAIWLTLAAAGAHPRARAAATCNQTFVKGIVKNETNQTMTKSAFAHGISNAVCNDQAPHDSIAANSEDQWLVGDNLFSTFVIIRYRLANGDEVELHVYAEKGNRSAPLSCAWTQVVSSPRAFDCRANWVYGGVTGQASVSLRVFPVARPAAADAARSRFNTARSCRDTSALIGTTTNKTGVALKLLSVSHGAADSWCGAPAGSQAPHSVGRWKLGGPRSGASARFVYRLPNGDDVDFETAVDRRGGLVGCAPVDRARAALFGCRAVRMVKPNSEAPRIDLQVFRVRAS